MPAARKGEVRKAVERDLGQLRLNKSALGATAMVLADELDDSENEAPAKATCARALIRTLERVRELTPSSEKHTPAKEKDALDELTERRTRRRDRGTAT